MLYRQRNGLIGLEQRPPELQKDSKTEYLPYYGMTDDEKRVAIMFDDKALMENALVHFLERFNADGSHKTSTEEHCDAYTAFLIAFYLNNYVRHQQLFNFYEDTRLNFPSTTSVTKERIRSDFFLNTLRENPTFVLTNISTPENFSDVSLEKKWKIYNSCMEHLSNSIRACRMRMLYAWYKFDQLGLNRSDYGLQHFPLPFTTGNASKALKIPDSVTEIMIRITDIGKPKPGKKKKDETYDGDDESEDEEEEEDGGGGGPEEPEEPDESMDVDKDKDKDKEEEGDEYVNKGTKRRRTETGEEKKRVTPDRSKKSSAEDNDLEELTENRRLLEEAEQQLASTKTQATLLNDEITQKEKEKAWLENELNRLDGKPNKNKGPFPGLFPPRSTKSAITDTLNVTRDNIRETSKGLKTCNDKIAGLKANIKMYKQNIKSAETRLGDVRGLKGAVKQTTVDDKGESELPTIALKGKGGGIRRETLQRTAAVVKPTQPKKKTIANKAIAALARRRMNIKNILGKYLEPPSFESNIPEIKSYDDFMANDFGIAYLNPERKVYTALKLIRRNKTQPSLQAMVVRLYFKMEAIFNTIRGNKDNKITGLRSKWFTTYQETGNIAQSYFPTAESFINGFQNGGIFGDAGTGKTTLAEIYQNLRYGMGIDATLNLHAETGAGLVTTGFAGQSALLADDFMITTIGTCRFIDEFYGATSGTSKEFGQDFINTIMATLSLRPGMYTIIIGGYAKETEIAMSENQGFGRRLQYQWFLMSPSIQELAELFVRRFWFTHIRNLLPSVNATRFYKHMKIIFRLLGGTSDTANDPDTKLLVVKKGTQFYQKYNYGLADVFSNIFESNIAQLALETFVYKSPPPQIIIDQKNAETWKDVYEKQSNLIDQGQQSLEQAHEQGIYDPNDHPVFKESHRFWESTLPFDEKMRYMDRLAFPLWGDDNSPDMKKIFESRVRCYKLILQLFVVQVAKNTIALQFSPTDCYPDDKLDEMETGDTTANYMGSTMSSTANKPNKARYKA